MVILLLCMHNARYNYLLTKYTWWLCAWPLFIGLTGPGAASSQEVSSVTTKGGPTIVVPSTVSALPITWYGQLTAGDSFICYINLEREEWSAFKAIVNER